MVVEQAPAASVSQRVEDLYHDVGSREDVGSVLRTLNDLSQPDKVQLTEGRGEQHEKVQRSDTQS